MFKKPFVYAGAAALAGLLSHQAMAIPVTLELALLVDVSGSVDPNEFALQQHGYAEAFRDPGIQALLSDPGLPGGIAVTYIQWSSSNEQAVKVSWTHLYDATTANSFADLIDNASRSYSDLTAPGSAINYARPLFGTEVGAVDNGFQSVRQTIDVSGDGSQNDGANTANARDAALAAGIDKINGLAILGSEANLLSWYEQNIQGGANSFTLAASSFAEFESAVRVKISAEIQNTNPVPDGGPSLILSSVVIGGLMLLRRRQS